MLKIFFTLSLLALSLSAFSSEDKYEITDTDWKEFSKKNNITALVSDIKHISPSLPIKKVTSKNLAKQMNLFLRNMEDLDRLFIFFNDEKKNKKYPSPINFITKRKSYQNERRYADKSDPLTLSMHANMCLIEFILREINSQTGNYPAHYLLRKMFLETADDQIGPYIIFLKALEASQEEALEYKDEVSEEKFSHYITLPDVLPPDLPLAENQVKEWCEHMHLFEILPMLFKYMPLAHMSTREPFEIISSITTFFNCFHERRDDNRNYINGTFIPFFKIPNLQHWKQEMIKEYSERLGDKAASRCWKIYHRRLEQLEHMASVSVTQALCSFFLPNSNYEVRSADILLEMLASSSAKNLKKPKIHTIFLKETHKIFLNDIIQDLEKIINGAEKSQ